MVETTDCYNHVGIAGGKMRAKIDPGKLNLLYPLKKVVFHRVIHKAALVPKALRHVQTRLALTGLNQPLTWFSPKQIAITITVTLLSITLSG